jgi:hypothetical protein
VNGAFGPMGRSRHPSRWVVAQSDVFIPVARLHGGMLGLRCALMGRWSSMARGGRYARETGSVLGCAPTVFRVLDPTGRDPGPVHTWLF